MKDGFKIDSKLLEDMEEKRRTVKKRAEEREIEAKTKMQTLKERLTETFFPELRIVLMGGNIVGKSSVVNTILKIKQEKNMSKKCVMSKGEVDKQTVILIDTPGWWPYASVKETSESVKQEIMSSVTCCPPGPHAVLLVLQSGVAFTEAQRRSVKEHMELLGRDVWKYCIVVFSRGDWIVTPTIEEHIESEGEDLQWLINQCGNRYHVINYMEQDDGKQVRELMEKVVMMARMNTDLLTPLEGAKEDSDSGWGSDQDRFERGSLNLYPPENCPALPEIKVIIIGSKFEYKCTAANTILGHYECKVGKEIVESEKKQRTNQSKSVTLVMTPGWWKSSTPAESAKYIQMEIVHSLKLCPDPHAFLLVINLHTTFTEMHLNSVVEHMEILGEQIWNHTIVLLMHNDKIKRRADNKKLIERAGQDLDLLIKKCGNRVHVFNYTDRRGTNVEKLFHKIENLQAEHKGQGFKMDSKLLEDMEEKRRTVKKQAEEREKKTLQTLREHLPEKSSDFPELRIVLMGVKIVGKTSVMNTILKNKDFSSVNKCVMREREVDKRKVILIETPGWWPYASVKETSESVKQEIMSGVTMCPPGPHAVLLVLQSGVAFTEAHRRTVKEHMELLGRDVWKYCIVIFTKGDWMGTPTIEEHIESEGETLQWLINKCGNRYHVLNNMERDDGKQVRELMEKVVMMARVNNDLLKPVEGGMEESDSGWASNMSDIDKLEIGSLNLDPPEMHEEDYVTKWLENGFDYRNLPDVSEDISEDVKQN
ncbi:GTPase IMAP family member 8 [Anabarilius grahami]|uniref:GTPase IMAP family member 8 n=1 Tax=Anabarilius grahami TaxID=495550 RepID=A0A3N0Z9T2_ANAGA|nr:GTPase IMAP family member 8 [Anabarilius grahami]